MYAKGAIRSLLTLLTCAFLSGCPPKYYVFELFNNTGVDVAVINVSDTVVIPTGEARQFRTSPQMAIATPDGSTWAYRPSELPLTVLDRKEIYRPEGDAPVKLQLEPDGALYLLRFTELAPVAQFSPQPFGFPVRPLGSNKTIEPTR